MSDPGVTPCRPQPRPSAEAWARLKAAKLAAAGLPWSARGAYQLDHYPVPLCLGGPNTPDNLRLQPWPEARRKDRVEALACRLACTDHRISFERAVEMVRDWRSY